MIRLRADCGAAVVTIGGASIVQNTPASAQRVVVYATNNDHFWNRVHEALHRRTTADGIRDAFDTVDPLLWREMRHLVIAPSSADPR